MISTNFGMGGEGGGQGGLGEIDLAGRLFQDSTATLIGNITLFTNSAPPSDYPINGGAGGGGGGAGANIVPQPNNLLLIALGLVGILISRRWRR